MRILAPGDLHWTSKQPKSRIDDYPQTLTEKFIWILELADRSSCKIICWPGDFFDSHRATDKEIADVIYIMRTYPNIRHLSVFGQHDLRFHNSDIENTPLNVLRSAECIQLLDKNALVKTDNDGKQITFTGCNWYEDPPEEVDEKKFNILVMHRMVIPDKELWPGQEDFERGNILLRRLPHDVIIAGDNHMSFLCKVGDRVLINCGSVGRKAIDQLDHKPVVYIIDTEPEGAKRFTVTPYYIPIQPAEEVFNIDEAEKEKRENKELELFMEKMGEELEIEGLDFISNLTSSMTSQTKGVQNILQEAMQDADRRRA